MKDIFDDLPPREPTRDEIIQKALKNYKGRKTFAGLPHLKTLSKQCGFKVSKKELLKLWSETGLPQFY